MRSLCNVSLVLGLVNNLTCVIHADVLSSCLCVSARACLVCLRTIMCAYVLCRAYMYKLHSSLHVLL